MDQIINTLFTDPLFVKIGIVLAVLISLSLLKKLVKVVITLVLIFLIYGYYVYSTGAEPVSIDDVKELGKVAGEVIDKVLKETSTKAIQENKIKPAGQPKIDLKTYGEDKDLEYVISVTELPKIDIKSLQNIKFDEYKVIIEEKETEKRIKEIAKSQKNFVEVDSAKVANEGDLVVFDYKATIDGKEFAGGDGKNTQLILEERLKQRQLPLWLDHHNVYFRQNNLMPKELCASPHPVS